MLDKKIRNRQSGIITYGITPPKENNPPERLIEIAQRQIERINGMAVDGLVIYDIQDESDRNKDSRPFPFISTVDSVYYGEHYLKEIHLPKIIYRCVGKYTQKELSSWVNAEPSNPKYSVFVGASSSMNRHNKLNLRDAYGIPHGPNFYLGGVAIPERHMTKKDEHLRIAGKQAAGCSFFISQVTYHLEAAKNFLSDYYYYCREHQIEMVPILFTITPCGSLQTLDFMKWLGISIPGWLENDLKHSEDILSKSLDLSVAVFRDLFAYATEKGIPVGCNIESLSVRRLEIEASVRLVEEIRGCLNR